MSAEPLPVVLCWHMHQPEYRDPEDGSWRAPWTYLHGIKDYVDMAAHLEDAPEGVRVVVNFPPVLLEQIDDYAGRIERCLEEGKATGEPLLDALACRRMPARRSRRRELLQRCLQAHEAHMIRPFPVFRHLAGMARHALGTDVGPDYLSDRHLKDLVVWYHLAWLGETVRQSDERVQKMLERAGGYTREERREMLALVGELMSGLIGRYRRLAERGVVELSASPYSHPMLPLLLDLSSARQAQPDIVLPESPAYPGGEERVRWQLSRAREVFEHYFGAAPRGCWPSEGGLCEASVRMIGEAGFVWTASGEGVLRNSLAGAEQKVDPLHRCWRLHGKGPYCFFRDEGLSDAIGFNYQQWRADDAVADLIKHLKDIGRATVDVPGRVVSIILDGENPWEHYPQNGFHFLGTLYRELAAAKGLKMVGFSDVIPARGKDHSGRLEGLVAGSWVYGTLNTWIGDPDKNRAWDLLCEARREVERVLAETQAPSQHAAIERQLAVCEGSDWFWWFGDYNPAEVVDEFERLYRRQLECLYRMIGVAPPAALEARLSRGSGAPELGGTMRRGNE